MNNFLKLVCFVCCLTMMGLGSLAKAESYTVSEKGSDNGKKTAPAVIIPANGKEDSLVPIPEPSTGSLILLSLGGVGLTLMMRRRA
jgi:hypothetical protein